MLFKIEKRTPSLLIAVIAPVLSFISALVVGGLFLSIVGISPIPAYVAMVSESLGSFYGITETLVKATPLILAGLGVTVASRMQLWNIGAEGQIAMGAFGASYVALFSGIQNSYLMIVAMMISAMFFAGIWGAIAGVLKAKLNISEVITTLLLNYVALSWVGYLVYGPWKDPKGLNFPFTAYFSDSARLTELFSSRLHTGFLIGIVVAVIVWIFLEKTVWGYEIKVIGNNPKAADYAGMHSKRYIIIVLFISGAIAGLAGMSEVAGLQHRLQNGISGGYGYIAIIVSWLAKRNPFGVIFVSILIGILLVGGEGLQLYKNVSSTFINMYMGLILFFLVMGDFFTEHKIRLIR